MLSENDKQGLLRNLNSNDVVLVLGAGFSLDCSNVLKEHLPTSKGLAAAIWSFLYEDEYDGTSALKTLYGAATKHRKGKKALREFLRRHLYATEIPEWYRLVTAWHWYRIYTFNADNVVEQLYPEEGINRVVAPAPYVERDPMLRSVQYIKLHGSLDEDKDLVFGTHEFATRALSKFDLWYQHFVEDYSTRTVLFVGTELDEPLFFQYVEARGQELGDQDRVRLPKCFLVKPTISKPLEGELKAYRIFPVRQTAKEFFEWLVEQQTPLTREEILRRTNRNLEPALKAAEERRPQREVEVLERFLEIFQIVRRPDVSANRGRANRSFLLGSPPTWNDIASDLDADRQINRDFRALIDNAIQEKNVDVIKVFSPAGAGKTTVMKRAALDLADDGYRVYFSDASQRPIPDAIVNFVLSHREDAFLFFDSAGPDISEIAKAWERLKSLDQRPMFIVAARTNDFALGGYEFERRGAKTAELPVPDMTDSDIHAVIKILDSQDLLGKLKDKSTEDRFKAFKETSRQQILVAMREATSGYGFDEILRDEFAKLPSGDAKLLYLIAAISADDDFGLTKSFIIGAMASNPTETVSVLDRSLSGILLPSEEGKQTYALRHPAIGEFIVGSADRSLLAEAVKALMTALWTILPEGAEKKNARSFTLYRRLLNHTYIQSKFPKKSIARDIYDTLRPFYRDDGHFWLQYASYEIESGDDLALAENYLNQAESLLGDHSRQVQTARAHLFFLKAIAAPNGSTANELMSEAVAILRRHMAEPKKVSWHALHIFGDQMRSYIWKWVITTERSKRFRDAYEEMRRAIPDTMSRHPLLNSVLRELKRAELETVVRER